MANSTIGVKLQFTADTSQAKSEMAKLQSSLTQIMQTTSSTTLQPKLTSEITSAQKAAAQLQTTLRAAFNEDTGKLDLGKFQKALQMSGTNLQQLKANLTAIGPQGTAAFNKLATSIATAEAPALRLSVTMQKFLATLGNTVRYQISARMFTAVTSGLQEALDYAKDLNTSLTNIQIVSDYSADEMDRFAEKANKSAKALRTTTVAMTDAALIYFQQGLNMEEAQKRAEVTVKMANVTGQSVETMSNQLTAVWNNFYDGSQSLEYYADVLAALGAATASSSDEITQGLEKFAAVAETVGLSYEYAATALATVTAETRQSADVVGTAFKTLFARIQDLELGKTLDDGTSLGKYSQALAAVGVNIKDSNGQLKEMDTILSEMASVWTTLGNDQQVALAQTVAGVRQYTQLMALMENWDQFEINLNIAEMSEGELQEQQDKYADSWEGASKRVTAALEAIYAKLLDDDTFIDLINFGADFIETLDTIIGSMGGLKGILLTVSTILLNIYGKSVAGAIDRVQIGFSKLTEKVSFGLIKIKQSTAEQNMVDPETMRKQALEQMAAGYGKDKTGLIQGDTMKAYGDSYQKLLSMKEKMNEAEYQTYELILKQNGALADQIIQKGYAAKEAENSFKMKARSSGLSDDFTQSLLQNEAASQLEGSLFNNQPMNVTKSLTENSSISSENLKKSQEEIKNLQGVLESLGITAEKIDPKFEKIFGADTGANLQNYVQNLNSVISQQERYNELLTRSQSENFTEDERMELELLNGEYDETIQKIERILTLEKSNKPQWTNIANTEESKVKAEVGENKYAKMKQELAEKRDLSAKKSKGIATPEDEKRLEALNKKYLSVDKSIKNLNISQAKFSNAISTNSKNLGAQVDILDLGDEKTKELKDALSDAGLKMTDAAMDSATFKEALKRVGVSIDELNNKPITFGQRIQAAASAISSLGMVMSSVQGLINTFTNPDMSGWDKFVSVLTTVGMIIPALTTVLNANNAAKALGITLTTTETGVTAIDTSTKMGSIAATIAQTLANIGLSASFAPLLAITLLFLAALAGIALVAVGVIAAVTAISNAIHAEEIALENASEELSRQKELVKTLTDEYNNLKDTMASLNDQWVAIDKMVEGTEEWEDAVAKVNQEVLDLMSRYPELSKYVTNTNGRLDIFDEGQQFILDQQQAAVRQAQMRQLWAQIDKNEATHNLKRSEAQTKAIEVNYNLSEKEIDEIIEGGFDRTGTIDYLTTDVYEIYANSEAADGGDAEVEAYKRQALANATYTSTVENVASQLQSLYDSGNWDEYYQKLGKLTSSNEESMNAVHELVVSTNNLNETNQFLLKQAAANAFADNADYQASNYKDYINSEAAKFMQDEEKKDGYKEKFEGLLAGNWFNDKSDEKAFAEYLSAVYGENIDKISIGDNIVESENYRVTEMGGTEQVLEQKQADGSWKVIDKHLTNEKAGSQYADAKIAQKAEAKIKEWEAKGKQYDDALKAGIKQREGENEDVYNARVAEIGVDFMEGKALDFGKLTRAEIEDLKNSNIINSTLTNDNGDSLGSSVNKAIEGYETARENATKAANDEWLKNRDKNEAEDLSNVLKEAEMDTAAFKEYSKQFSQYGKDAERVAKQTLKLSNAVHKLSNVFEENEEALDSTNEGSADYIQAVTKVQESLTDMLGVDLGYDYVQQNLEKIKKAANGNVEAIDELQLAAARKIVVNMDLNQEDATFLNDWITTLENTDITARADLDTSAFIDRCNEMLATGQVSMEQLQGYFDEVGFVPEVGEEEVDGPETVSHINGKVFGFDIGEVAEVRSTSKIKIPKIQGGSYKPPSTTTTPAAAKATKKSGGGGSKEKKNLSDEIERYHELDKTLERLNKEYDKISKAKDRAFGKSRLNLINQEISKIDELAQKTRDKLGEAEKNLAKDRENLSQFGASFNEHGEITNYEELVKAQVEAYNKDPEGQEENYENFQKYLSQYEETLGIVQDLNIELDDYDMDKFDKKLEGIQYQVELDVRLADNDLALIEFQLEQLDDTATDVAKKFDLLGQSMEANEKKMEAASKGIGEILGLSGIELQEAIANPEQLAALVEGKELTEDQIAALEDYVNQMYEGINAMKEMRDAISDDLIAAFEDMNEDMDNSISRLEHLNSMVDSYRNIIDLAGREALGVNAKLMEQMSKSQYQIANSNIEVNKAKYKQNAEALASLEKQIQDARAKGDEESVKELEEAYDELYQTVWEDEQALLDATSAGLEAAAALFEEEMNNIVGVFEDAMTGAYGTFAAMQEAFDQQKEINDRYLDDYTKIYNLSKLNRDLVNSIDNSDSIWTKTRLRDLQQEINDLQESNTKMTQYEVDELRAKYDLRLAEIALEEAQNAKSQVRMTRTAEGNWSYMYTADEDATSKAEQGYEDKLYAYQQLVQNYTDEMQARLIQIPAEYAEAVKTIYQDQTLNDQERQLKIMETQTYYEEMYAHVIEQLGISNEDAAALYKEDWSRYAQMTGYKISEDQMWVDNFSETIAAQITGFETLDAAQLAFQSSSETMLSGLATTYEEYRGNVKSTLDAGLGDMESFLGLDGSEGGLKYYLDEASKEAKEAADEAKRIGDENAAAFEKATTAAGTWLTTYSEKIDEWTTKTGEIATTVNSVTTAYANLDKQLESTKGKYDEITAAATAAAAAQNSAGSSGGGSPNNGPPAGGGDVLTINLYTGDAATNDFTASTVEVSKAYVSPSATAIKGKYPITVLTTGNNKRQGFVNAADKKKIVDGGLMSTVAFDTGGYTGKWDSSGRLAMLHQKEIVLNAHDTENFLAGINILRDITSAIDLQALSQANMMSAIKSVTTSPMTQKLEQSVSIQAEFPNVTEKSEIEAAFESLLNRASQFANRKNK